MAPHWGHFACLPAACLGTLRLREQLPHMNSIAESSVPNGVGEPDEEVDMKSFCKSRSQAPPGNAVSRGSASLCYANLRYWKPVLTNCGGGASGPCVPRRSLGTSLTTWSATGFCSMF